jgi:hypothetical protein
MLCERACMASSRGGIAADELQTSVMMPASARRSLSEWNGARGRVQGAPDANPLATLINLAPRAEMIHVSTSKTRRDFLYGIAF